MKTIYWVGGFVLVLGGLFFLFSSGGVKIDPPFEIGKLHPLDHINGNAKSSVVVTEYSDFECPACRAYYPMVRQIVEEFGGSIAFVYRHFPLNGIHPNAELAARASEAAHKQDKFWQMHDLLFEKQNEWSKKGNAPEMFENYALLLGLDMDKFKIDFKSAEIKALVSAERVHSLRSGLTGTPTFFINGQKIENPKSIEDFREAIKKAINRF